MMKNTKFLVMGKLLARRQHSYKDGLTNKNETLVNHKDAILQLHPAI